MARNLTFLPLDVDKNREFLLAAHRETSRLTFGTAFDDGQIEREIEKERGKSTGVFLDGKIVGICDVEQRDLSGNTLEAAKRREFYGEKLRGRRDAQDERFDKIAALNKASRREFFGEKLRGLRGNLISPKHKSAVAGWVHFFYITPELRGLGYGAALVEHAENFCRERGLDKLCLRVGEPNDGARRFYERCGFVHAPELDKPGEIGLVKSLEK